MDTKRLSESQVAAFHTDGYLTGLPIFTDDECRSFRANAERFERKRPSDVAWAFDIKANLLFDWVYQFSAHPSLLDIIEELIGLDIFLTDSIFRIKEPDSSTHYGWHQDAARISVEPHFVIVYIAVGEATMKNGCLRVIPGSHDRVHPFGFVDYSKRKVARVKEVDETQAVDLVLEPGQVGIFDCNTIHGSGPNRSGHRRFALINDYTPAVARQNVGKGSGQLVRGEDRFGSWGREPVPQGDCIEQDVLARRRVLCTYPENVLMGPLEQGDSPSFADQAGATHVRFHDDARSSPA